MRAKNAPLLIDVSRLIWRRWRGRHPTGIDRVCLAYLGEFAHEAQAVVQYQQVRRILDLESSRLLFDILAKPAGKFRQRLLSQTVLLGLTRGAEGLGRTYLNVGHTGLSARGFHDWVRAANVRPVYFVHDLIPISHPEYCRAGERSKHVERMTTVLRTAAGIIANSAATTRQVESFASTIQVAVPPTLTALLGSSHFRHSADFCRETERPTFVVLGTIEARKNHLMLLQVWTRIVERLGENAPRLLILGQRGWECEQVLDFLERSEILKGSVFEIGDCSDEMLAKYLSTARALLFPSLVEGYGLPLIEALCGGTPVIASDLPVFRENAGDVPDYLDPLDGPSWESTIIEYAKPESSARHHQFTRMQDYNPPTWENHFATVRAWLSTL